MKESAQINQSITFPACRKAHWRESIPGKLIKLQPGPIQINCQDWRLNCRELKYLKSLCDKVGLKINLILSNVPETLVSASALGHQTHLNLEIKESSPEKALAQPSTNTEATLLFYQGTIRAGEHLENEGDVLLLGDVNPGARISAGGDVMVWGRLRGIAHAGKSGNHHAKIVALQLRPLQLRIANKVARGPEEKPEQGLAEEAVIVMEQILIRPANTDVSNPD